VLTLSAETTVEFITNHHIIIIVIIIIIIIIIALFCQTTKNTMQSTSEQLTKAHQSWWPEVCKLTCQEIGTSPTLVNGVTSLQHDCLVSTVNIQFVWYTVAEMLLVQFAVTLLCC